MAAISPLRQRMIVPTAAGGDVEQPPGQLGVLLAIVGGLWRSVGCGELEQVADYRALGQSTPGICISRACSSPYGCSFTARRSSRAAMSCSAASRRRNCNEEHHRFLLTMRPSSVKTSSGCLRRSCPRARSAICSAEAPPSVAVARVKAGPSFQQLPLPAVGGLQQLEQPVALGRLALHQLAAVAQQLAQIALRLRRHEALGDQAVADQIGDPLCIPSQRTSSVGCTAILTG